MKHRILSAVLAAFGAFVLMSGAASAQQDGNMSGQDKSMNKSMMNNMDKKWMMETAMGGMLEVEMGRLATERGMSDEVKQFGQRMVDDHGKANDELKQLAESKGVMLPTELDAKHKMMVEKMSKMSGAAFDNAYKKEMLKDHKKDVASFQREADKGMDADVKAFAAKTLPTLKEHLSMIEGMNGMKMSKGNGM